MFYLTGKQVKTKTDFGHWKQYNQYVTSLVEDGDRVKCLGDYFSSHGVNTGDTGTVVGHVRNVLGRNLVTVRWDKRGNDVNMACDCIEILN